VAKRTPTGLAPSSAAGKRIRCAIYTRKSTEEGLDQAFNSLDAQHEACSAFITSQRHEGWTAVQVRYDDGGYSGGTMERPGLKALLADIEAGKIDVIVVYKVDRLTRALSDFAKIVEILDAKGASFVSVTQAFNTTTSMGRLTLNVLLSFAQFEREVTGERIRDKIAASKKKGMWMGGPVPLGYDVRDRKLMINATEAETARFIFQRFIAVRTIVRLVEDLARHGVRSKVRVMRDGRTVGGQHYRAGALAHLLRNPIYIGRIRHRDQLYDGEHEGIIDRAVWEQCQLILNGGSIDPKEPSIDHGVSLLTRRIKDEAGRPMTTAHAVRGQRRYRYYTSCIQSGDAQRAWRVPAGEVHSIIQQAIVALVGDPASLLDRLGSRTLAQLDLSIRCRDLAEVARDMTQLRAMLLQLDARVTLTATTIDVELDRAALIRLVGASCDADDSDEPIHLSLPTSLRRRGQELRLVHGAAEHQPQRVDPVLIKLLAGSRVAYEQLRSGSQALSATRKSHLVRLARLTFLAPDIVTMIVEGRQPVELTSRALLRCAELPLCWSEQRRLFCIA